MNSTLANRSLKFHNYFCDSKGSINWLKIATLASILLCIGIQIYFVTTCWEKEQRSDALIYYNYASACLANHEFYPSFDNLHDNYLFAPGFVNYVILQMIVFGSGRSNMLLNIILSLAIAYDIYFLGKKLFNRETALWAVILYSLLYSTWRSVFPLATEVPFIFLVVGAICLALNNKPWASVVCGLCLGLANTIRPLVIIALPTILLLMWYVKSNKVNYLYLFATMGLIIVAMGGFVYSKTGIFAPQSTTSGVNLLMTSHDNAKGNNILNDPVLIIEDGYKYTFAQKDSIYKDRAIKWIKENPTKYAKLYVLKLFGLYSHDAGYEGFYENSEGFGSYEGNNYSDLLLRKAAKSIVYYITLAAFIITLFLKRRQILTIKGSILIMLLLGTLSTCLFSTITRYHIPLLFIIILWASYGISDFFNPIRNKHIVNK